MPRKPARAVQEEVSAEEEPPADVASARGSSRARSEAGSSAVSRSRSDASARAKPGSARSEALARVKTGIPGFDELVGGGVPAESTVLLTGDPGSGKTTFASQFLHAGARDFGEAGVFITFEERKEDWIRHMAGYGWDLAGLVRDKRLTVFEYPPHEIEKFIEQGGVIQDAIADTEAKRLVIDSIGSIAMLFDNEYKMRQSIVRLLGSLKKWGTTSLLVSEGSMDVRGEPHDRFGLEFLTDGTMYFYNVREAGYRRRQVEIIELKGTKHSSSVHDLLFGKTGLEIHQAPV